ncbi:MAG: hypothetical protein J7J86_09685 [Bacteroidales bacterium]|nr:hypothetical protein [Bacteroidales bacterium]
MEKETPMQKKKINTSVYKIIIASLGIIVLILAYVLINTNNKNKELLSEKEEQRLELKQELDSLIVQHENIKIEYGELSESLKVKDSIINKNAQEIKKLLDTKYRYYLVKKKLNKLRKISQNYLHQIDSLYTVNKELKNENIKLTKNYKKEQLKNQELSKIKEVLSEKVSTASILKTYNVKAQGIHLRGRKKEVKTYKARRLDKIKVVFTLAENKIIPAGKRTIYVRIAQPDKAILAKGKGDKYSFDFKGEKLQYSIKKEINYENEALEITLYWIKNFSKKPIMPGIYTVSLFCGDNLIGETHLELK